MTAINVMDFPTTNIAYGSGNLKRTDVEVEGLEAELRKRLRGEVRFDNGSRALYSTDASNYRQIPIGVVIPRDSQDVSEAIAVARRFGAPVLARGGGTSLAGQCCNVAVILDMSKYMNRVIEVDTGRRIARVQPGTILDDLRDAAERYKLTFGPDPATHNHCTLGGMLGNDSCGIHSILAAYHSDGARTADQVEELEILTYDGLKMRVGKTSDEEYERIVYEGGRRGEIYKRLKNLQDKYAREIRERFPDIPRRVSGYNLPYLLPENGFNIARSLVGSEGTCVTILEATVGLIPNPAARSLLVLGYPDVYTAGDHVPEIMQYRPIGLEGIDHRLVTYMERKGLHTQDITILPEGGGWLLVEFGGNSKDDADEKARRLMAELRKKSDAPSMKLFDDEEEESKVWEVRESGLGATAHVPGMSSTWPGWEDSSVSPEKLGGYLRDLRKLFNRYGYECALYGHFGQGCVHVRIDFDLLTREGIDQYLAFINDAAELVVSYGGSLSGEHGDGQARAALLPIMYGERLMEAFREFKSIWDPEWKMNPGKIIEAYAPDQNLRVGSDYKPRHPSTHFHFPDDNGDFANSTLRCVGVGKCRRLDGGTMCPSFMATREEEHSTRGRARMLFEMLEGDVIGKDGWHDEHVKEALDLCLACKGCKSDCPVNVDMATYKAEFLSHYYEGRLRPRSAYAFGLIYWWSRVASMMPGIVNFFTQTPGLSLATKLFAGVAKERRIPRYAGQTFKEWFRNRKYPLRNGPRAILWPDTFNNHFHPETAKAAVEVLESAGYQLIVPERSLCCGRPLYDYGFLDLARKMLEEILERLRDEIRAGTPIIGLEPSCVAVFRDELPNLFPFDEDAVRLKGQVYLFSEFLQTTNGYEIPRLHKKAIVHGHCHHKAIMGLDDERSILDRLELDYEILDSGCCGMAGSFGFEGGDHYDVSIKAGERVLLPTVRKAAKETLIIADGFSCRAQISQATNRHALHLAQVIQMAIREGPDGSASAYPEDGYITDSDNSMPSTILRIATAACAGIVAGGAIGWLFMKACGKR